MGKNKRIRKGIESLEQRIREHENKIAIEGERYNPDYGLIAHWKKEIDGGNGKSKANEIICREGHELCL